MRSRLAEVVAGLDDLPLPGGGDTAGRLRRLADAARNEDQSVVRLAEAHLDALAIAAEAGHDLVAGAIYGVWASGGDLTYDAERGRMTGVKPFCSGALVVDRALVTTASPEGLVLVDVPVGTAMPVVSPWATVACADTGTATLSWSEEPVDAGAVVGGPGWYLDRVGFWQGACSPAATWAGAAMALVDHAVEVVDDGQPHALALVGSMVAERFTLEAALDRAGRVLDASPHDPGVAQQTALALRHVVERAATRILDDFGQCLGPRPFVSAAWIARLSADLHLLLRQQHGPDDDARLGRRAVATNREER